ncbi:hypothetical protein ACIO3O_01775 [Streptomyces sp. NPDC087440]|uniref:hypothetical protein n=1 Tax=Streptomyces sp. NPDC087440 TaxID=3365790 RepID=UPI003827F5B3
MRKAFTASAVTVVTAAALAVPAAAFADTPAPAPTPVVTVTTQQGDDGPAVQTDTTTADKAQVALRLSAPGDPAGFHAGESVTLTATTSANASGGVTVSSPAFGTTHLAPTDASGISWSGTAVISPNAGTGTLPVKSVADFGDTGAQASASILVNTTPAPTPTPHRASLSLSTDGARPGDTVRVTIDSGDLKGAARVESGAFGGTVNLTRDAGSTTWHGTATVAASAKPGYDRVDGYVGDQKIDSVKFGIADTPQRRTTPHRTTPAQHHTTTPVRVDGRTVPKGAVNAGASAGPASSGTDTGLIAGAAGLSAAALLGGTVLWRRRTQR